MGAPLPPVIPEPFAKNADPTLIQNPIPQTTGAAGRASYDQGFPAITMQPVAAGGKPPFGQDFNGLFFALTSQQYFAQAGQLWPYNATVSAAISGYGVGAVLISSDGATVWLNTVAGNTTDPDGGSAAGWVSLFTYGQYSLTSVGGITPVTLTPQQARNGTIIISGTLIANLTVILPAQASEWLIVNLTGGAFTTTVRTASGTGVVIPQGGFSNPVGVYGAIGNIYPTVPASSLIPASQAATPSTLAQRNNTGQLLATYFNSSAAVENLSIANVFTDHGDGTIRKNSGPNFAGQFTLDLFAGQVLAAQVPAGAVTQYAAAILANAVLTGTPVAPTPANGDSSSRVPNTAWVNPFSLLAMPGAFRLPSGHLICYGTANPAGGGVTVTLPGSLSYTSSSDYAIVAISVASGSVQTWVATGSQTANSFSLHNTGGSSFWFTIGF